MILWAHTAKSNGLHDGNPLDNFLDDNGDALDTII